MNAERPLVALLILLLGAGGLARRGAAVRPVVGSALVLLGSLMAVRWVRSGHPPVFGTFETDLADTFVLLLMGLWLSREAGERYLLGPLAVASLTLGHTFLLRPEATPLTISERSLWIDVHAALAWLAWSFYFHSALLSFREVGPRERALQLLGFAFLAQTAMGFTGVYYATLLFASPWSWDPVQTLGLLSWLLCALALHFRLFFGVSLFRQRYFLLVVVAAYVASGKLILLLPPGQSFHVFELGAMAGAR